VIAFDRTLSAQAIEIGAAAPALWTTMRWLTELGGAPLLWLVSIGAAIWLWLVKKLPRHAALLIGTAVTGRVTVEILKATTARPRPDLVEHQVYTHSLSMPSGHAANSMIVYLAIALIAAPARHRAKAVAAALFFSFLPGLSRPILGVHWPSDVLAGWLWGAGWALACVALGARWLEGDRAGPPSPSS